MPSRKPRHAWVAWLYEHIFNDFVRFEAWFARLKPVVVLRLVRRRAVL